MAHLIYDVTCVVYIKCNFKFLMQKYNVFRYFGYYYAKQNIQNINFPWYIILFRKELFDEKSNIYFLCLAHNFQENKKYIYLCTMLYVYAIYKNICQLSSFFVLCFNVLTH